MSMKKLLLTLVSAGLLALGAATVFGQAEQKEKKGK